MPDFPNIISPSRADDPPITSYFVRSATASDLPALPSVESSAATLFRSDPDLAPVAQDGSMSVETHGEFLGKWKAFGAEVGDSGTWVAVARRNGRLTKFLEDEAQEDEVVGFIVTTLLPVERKRRKSTEGAGAATGVQISKGDIREQSTDSNISDTTSCYLHIEELSIHAEHQRKGLASKLLRTVKDQAERLSVATPTTRGSLRVVGLSLTTMRDVAFNGPFYAKFGFHEIPVDGDGGIVDVIGERGWDVWQGDQEHFRDVGDGTLKERRCWMVCDVGARE